jgi:GH35 family endo-1,4-beta-xylanase
MRSQYSLAILISIFLFSVFVLAMLALFLRPSTIIFGATVSPHYADELGVNVEDVLRDAHQQLGIRHFRIPVHWWRYEPFENEFNFSELDNLISYADESGLHITLAIGQKVPRWPECFTPSWAEDYSQPDYELALLNFTQQVIARYADSPSVRRWQVENEAFFPFGECRELKPDFVELEYKIARSVLMNRAIQTTTSGEQAFWASGALRADIVGASLYRTVASPGLGYLSFPHTPLWYRAQATLVSLVGAKPIISELQIEPWGVHEIDKNSEKFTKIAVDAFPVERIEEQVYFARATGMRDIYFWGIEWWYLIRQRGDVNGWNKIAEIVDKYGH